MATRQFTPKPRKGSRASPARDGSTRPARRSVSDENSTARTDRDFAGDVYGVPVPDGLHEAIEAERGNLAKAESLLGCLAISMEYETDSMTAPYYPDVAEIARDLVRRSINALDSLTLQQHLLRNKVKEESYLLIAGGECGYFWRRSTYSQATH